MICNIPKGMGMLGQFGRLFAMETLVSVLFMRLLEELITRCSQGKSIWCSKVPKKVLFFLGGGGGVVHELWVRFQQ